MVTNEFAALPDGDLQAVELDHGGSGPPIQAADILRTEDAPIGVTALQTGCRTPLGTPVRYVVTQYRLPPGQRTTRAQGGCPLLAVFIWIRVNGLIRPSGKL